MELVENEPNARPFQCDWQACNKVRAVPRCWRETGLILSRASTGSLIYRDITEFTRMRGHIRV